MTTTDLLKQAETFQHKSFLIYDEEHHELFSCSPRDEYDMRRLMRILSEYEDKPIKQNIVLILENQIRLLFGIGYDELKIKDRHVKVKSIRHVVCHVLYKHTKLSNEKIGEIIGRDHATVLNGRAKVKNAIEGFDEVLLHYHDIIVNRLKEIGAV